MREVKDEACLRRTRPRRDGRIPFAGAGPGRIFGEIADLNGGERMAGATAITRVQAMYLPQRALLEAIANNPKVAMAAIHFLCMRMRETDQRQEAIALHRIEVRLVRLLPSALRLQSLGAEGSGASRAWHVAGRAGAADRRQPSEGQHHTDHARGHGRDRAGRRKTAVQYLGSQHGIGRIFK
jgi:CRP-like cAMP-binding protein